MERLKINMEIELKDIINSILIVLGGILTYLLVTSVELENEKLKTKSLILERVNDLNPNLKTNYTNQFSKNKDTLYLKVFIKNLGNHSVFYTSPNLYLINKKDTIQHYETPNLFDYWGTISPGQEIKIEYLTYNYSEDSIPNYVRMRYPVSINNNLDLKLLEKFMKSDEDKALLKWITNKDFLYAEKTYNYLENRIWNDFFENPR